MRAMCARNCTARSSELLRCVAFVACCTVHDLRSPAKLGDRDQAITRDRDVWHGS